MKTTITKILARVFYPRALAALFLCGTVCAPAVCADSICRSCRLTASLARLAALGDARSAFYLDVGKAINLVDLSDRRDAFLEARSDYVEEMGLIREQYAARLDLCESLDECVYDPEVDPANFVTPAEAAANPNPYFPLTPGLRLTYEALTDEGELETIVVEVTDDTIEIMGIACTVVRDTVSIDDELVEDTYDWYAQDREGNVWYMGELSFNYEDGEIEDLEGSWKAGVDGAKPGILTAAHPSVGDVYRQEWLLGEAEDAAEVLALNASATVPAGTFANCRLRGEFTPLEPDGYEEKYFAPGIGMVLEIKPETGEAVELIAVEQP